jgi:hypothetical protein
VIGVTEYSKVEALCDYETVVSNLKSTYGILEKIGPKFHEWANDRRKWEEKEGECDCISQLLDDSSVAMSVLLHVIHTYGLMLQEWAQHMEAHTHGGELPFDTDQILIAVRKAESEKKSSGKTRH